MSHFVAVVVTKSPADLDAVLAPFDENLEVDPYPEVAGTVAEMAARARDFWIDYPQYVPTSVSQWYWDKHGFTSAAHARLDIGTHVIPGAPEAEPWDDAGKDKHVWNNRDDARAFLAEIPDEVIALAYVADDYENARIDGETVVHDSTRNPASKWDWWSVGGRWRGYWHRKPAVIAPLPMNEQLGRLEYDPPRVYALPDESRLRAADPDYATVGMRVLGEGETPRPGDAVLGTAGTGEWAEQRDKGHAVDDYAGRADQLQWRDVDLAAMREAARVKAMEDYDKYEAAVGSIPAPDVAFPALADAVMAERGIPSDWDAYRTATAAGREAGGDSWRTAWDEAMAEARSRWSGHPWVRALREARCDPFEDPTEFYCVHTGGRDAYVAHWTARAGVPRALVIDGQWITKGEMGWFGMSDDTVTQDEWNAKVQDLYASLDPELWVTAVDLHI